jgi:hypothetical protein
MFVLSELPEHTADLWLESLARGTMHVYSEEILKIHDLTPHAIKQLVTDIGEVWLKQLVTDVCQSNNL